ncbi:MAG: DUF364 domain-containing protein [Chloroflexi bacterium]|nr:DUF364 domain-containing protein [Chloroflexota bacterium]
MNTILSTIYSALRQDYPVKLIEVCAHWTLITSRHSGMASTVLGCQPHGEQLVSDAGSLLKKSALELAAQHSSPNSLEVSIALAAINSLLDPPTANRKVVNVADVLLEKGKGKNVAFIGHFPFASKIKQVAKTVWIIDLQPTEGEYPPSEAKNLLPQADILAMTANTLINDWAEKYLSLCDTRALKIMMGPSTPMTPLLFDFGLDILAGVHVIDAGLVHDYIAQGAAFSQVKGIEKITLTR